jgi:hypothetical protein
MIKLLATSVVRGSSKGESHGGVYLVDFDGPSVELKVDWKNSQISWRGRGAERGLRGIAFDSGTIYIAASDELLAFDNDFRPLGSWRNRYLRHCHEVGIRDRTLLLTSTAYDSILFFDLDTKAFDRGIHIAPIRAGFEATAFDPAGEDGPPHANRLHISNVIPGAGGIQVSGMNTGGILDVRDETVSMLAELPRGTHNARLFNGGVLFNDTSASLLRFVSGTDAASDRAIPVPAYHSRALTHTDLDDSRIARQGFARGLCLIDDDLVAAGSSPSTAAIYALQSGKRLASVNLTMDIRSAIHGLAVWPY